MIESQTKLPAQELRGTPAPGRSIRPSGPAGTAGDRVTDKVQDVSHEGLAPPSERPAHAVPGLAPWALIRALRLAARQGFNPEPRSNPLFSRYALHAVVILLALGVATVSQVRLPTIEFLFPVPTAAPELGERTAEVTVSSRGVPRLLKNSALLFQAPVPHTTIPDRDTIQIITYTVKPNDTVWGIAQAFGIEVETIMWANPEVEKDPDLLSVGQSLVILPVNGMYYTVKKGDTVESLAKTYKTTVEKIVTFELNRLQEPYALAAGQKIVIPDGKKPIPPRAPPAYIPMQVVGKAPAGAATGSGRFMWPCVGHWSRGVTSYHHGIDLANRAGTPIYAADAGYVSLAGWDTAGYGNQVVINHGNGFLTRYAHLSKIFVKAGQSVARGEKIGAMGCTGRCTGPHLHFEIIKGGAWVNPLSYLPR